MVPQPSKVFITLDEVNHVRLASTVVVYFGYAGCSKECPMALVEMQQLAESTQETTFLFVNLFTNMSEGETLNYMSAFSGHITPVVYSDKVFGPLRRISAQPIPSAYWEKRGHIDHANAFFVLKQTSSNNTEFALESVIPAGKNQLQSNLL